jgi:uncharacterized protein
MIKQTLIIVTAFVFSACNKPAEPSKISVQGEGKIRVMPDKVTLTLDVGFTEPRMADAVRKTQLTVDSLVMILKTYSTNPTDIKTSNISANKAYTYVGNKSVFTGYEAMETIDFVLNDISKFTDLTARILETKIQSISGIEFGHTRADSILREADLLAYDDALKSVIKLSSRANVNLGKLLYAGNVQLEEGAPMPRIANSINTYNKGYGGEGFKLSPDVMEFKRSIIATYEVN